MKLSDCKKGQTVQVTDSIHDIFDRHGLVDGEEIEIVNNNCLMPMQLMIRGSKVAIRKSVAKQISVTVSESKE